MLLCVVLFVLLLLLCLLLLLLLCLLLLQLHVVVVAVALAIHVLSMTFVVTGLVAAEKIMSQIKEDDKKAANV